MSLYDDMQAVAKDVLTDFNQGVIQYVAVTPGNGPADNPGPATETPYTLTAATARGVQFRYVQNGMAIASDSQITMAVDSRFTPDVKGFVIKDNVRYKIVQVVKKPDAGTVAAYVLIIRQGP